MIVSCEVVYKPDPGIYRLCRERLGLPAEDTLFVDDRADNIAGGAPTEGADEAGGPFSAAG